MRPRIIYTLAVILTVLNIFSSSGWCREEKKSELKISLKIIDVQDKAYVHDQTYATLKQYLPGLKESFIDYRLAKARSLMDKSSAQTLPIYMVSSSVKKIKELDWFFSQVIPAGQNSIQQDRDEYFLINNAKDPVRLYLKRERKPGHMDLFVMSKCPFGIEAEQAIYPVAKESGIDLRIYYITDSSPNPNPALNQKSYRLTSLHGVTELEEDTRQLCANKYFPQRYFAYILARNRDINNPRWDRPATETLGKDAEAIIRKCQNEEGQTLLEKNAGLAAELRINSSPTILWENQRRFEGLRELKAGLKLFKDIQIRIHGSCK